MDACHYWKFSSQPKMPILNSRTLPLAETAFSTGFRVHGLDTRYFGDAELTYISPGRDGFLYRV
jgi:hypothetical protein